MIDQMVDPFRWADSLRDPHCTLCPLGDEWQNKDKRCLPGYGPEDAEIMIIGEAPGEQEIKWGVRRPFSGPAGNYL
ncbi:MAG: uracil-DNA glycosylase family protein, partial [Thermodesulfovibrionales bacterium]